MTQGLSLLKEHYIDDAARPAGSARRASPRSSTTTAVVDRARGAPRHETDPMRQAEDYHGAVTAAMRLPGVDPSRVAVRGIGHSGGAVMIGAGDDPRIRAVILNMPFNSGGYDAAAFPPGLLARAWADREAVAARPGAATIYDRPWPDSRESARGEAGEPTFLTGEDPWTFISGSLARSEAVGTPWQNKLSLQSFCHL